ncbi:MAG: hypothetical protein LBD25_01165 [Coriobacteriales bacterium]|nr:hypothetical protein [Coriobacteriales bacterium]
MSRKRNFSLRGSPRFPVEFWKESQQLTDEDYRLLKPLIEKARVLGYTPTKAEVQESADIKWRFRTWGDAVKAAGLPSTNSPEQQRLRALARQRTRKEDAREEKAIDTPLAE